VLYNCERLFNVTMSEGVKAILDLPMSKTTAASRQEVSFDEAFTLHHRTVFRCARAVVNDSGLAEVFLRLYNHLDRISNEEMLKPWLIRVTINLSRNAIRGHIRAANREDYYAKSADENDSFTSAPETDLERREQAQAVRQALDKVKEPLRSCLVLKTHGLSYKEISDALSLNEGSVGTFLARARNEFARYYGKVGSDG
jgi:RNA polymerase sigma factor (sigma-70 family)